MNLRRNRPALNAAFKEFQRLPVLLEPGNSESAEKTRELASTRPQERKTLDAAVHFTAQALSE